MGHAGARGRPPPQHHPGAAQRYHGLRPILFRKSILFQSGAAGAGEGLGLGVGLELGALKSHGFAHGTAAALSNGALYACARACAAHRRLPSWPLRCRRWCRGCCRSSTCMGRMGGGKTWAQRKAAGRTVCAVPPHVSTLPHRARPQEARPLLCTASPLTPPAPPSPLPPPPPPPTPPPHQKNQRLMGSWRPSLASPSLLMYLTRPSSALKSWGLE